MASEKKALEAIALLSMYGDEDDEMKNSMGVAACVVRPPSASHPIDLHRHAQPPAAQSIYTATLSHPPTFAPSTVNCCITDTTSARAQIWDEDGESDEDRDNILLQLEQECLNVCRRKVDLAVSSDSCLSHLYGVLKSKMMTSVCQFMEPFGVSYVPKAPHEESARALFQGLERVSPSQLAIVPCNVGNHWILTIIDPHKEMVSLVDPLSHRNRDNSWKEVVNKAITMFNAKIGRRGKKQPNWEIIKAPLQPDSKQCGFFVMRYMREIIDELANNGSISLKSLFDNRRYSQEEIDEVRIEWANCVLEHI